MKYHVIMMEDYPIYVCICSDEEARARVSALQEQYNIKHNIKSAWKKAVNIKSIEVQGDAPNTTTDIPSLEVIEAEIENESNGNEGST